MIIKFNEIKKNSSNFINNKPFPHIVLDNIFDYEFLSLIENEIKNIQE